jgi:hypothetical protein
MDTLSFTLTDHRAIDGVIATVNRQNVGRTAAEWVTVDQFWAEQVTALAKNMANSENVGIVTSAGFIQRFTTDEYSGIVAASQTDADVAALINTLIGSAYVYLDDARILPGLQQLVTLGLLEADRISEIVAYDRPEPTPAPAPPVVEDEPTLETNDTTPPVVEEGV